MRTFRAGNRESVETQRLAADVEHAAMQPQPFVLVRYLPNEPDKVMAGMWVGADGTNWNPGSGEGIYRRNAANSAWVFIG